MSKSLTPAIVHLLLALADEDRHGYGIMQEVARLTDGAARMGPAPCTAPSSAYSPHVSSKRPTNGPIPHWTTSGAATTN
jgi:hypothetical protein